MLVLGVAFPEIDGDSLLSDEKSFDELHSIFEAEGANFLNGLVTVVETRAWVFWQQRSSQADWGEIESGERLA